MLTRTLLAAAGLLLPTACSVTVPEARAPAVGALKVSEEQQAQQPAEGPTTAPEPAAVAPPSSSGALRGRPLNRAEELLPTAAMPW